jgi:hypothetical protein
VWQFFVTSFAAKKVSKKIVSDKALQHKHTPAKVGGFSD